MELKLHVKAVYGLIGRLEIPLKYLRLSLHSRITTLCQTNLEDAVYRELQQFFRHINQELKLQGLKKQLQIGFRHFQLNHALVLQMPFPG